MTPLQLANLLLEADYKYSNTDITPSPEMSDFVLEWNQLNIPDDVLHTDPDGGKGREREPHVTVKYGLLSPDIPEELRQICKETPPFPVFLGTVSLFTTNPEFDVVKIDVESPWLRKLNQQISDTLPHEDTHPEYKPHLTLAYVEKGACDHLVGDDPFKAEGVQREFTAYGLNFSGAGDDNEPGRVKEPILFSKVKKPVAESVAGQPRYRPSYTKPVVVYQRNEIATLASALVEAWAQQQLTTDQMTRRLRSGSWSTGMKYWHNRQQFPQAFKRFVEQAEQYIDKLREITFAETVNGVDPFAQCAFPADPDRIRLFLRSNGRRRPERPIL